MNIRGKALLFIGVAGLSTSLLMGSLFLWGMSAAEELLNNQTAKMADHVTREAENFAEEELQKRMEAVIRQRAHHVELFMMEMQGDVYVLARQVTELMKEGAEHPPQHIYDPRREDVHSGQLYFLAGAAGGNPPREAMRLAPVGETMQRLVKDKQTFPLLFYIGSRDGWSLRLNITGAGKMPINLPPAALTPAYDARDRSWYKAGQEMKDKKFPVYLPLYEALGGTTMLTCVMPYEDADGFAGVVGLAVPIASILQEVEQEVLTGEKISFTLNPQGQIVFSSQHEGLLAPGRPDFDLRSVEEQTLAETAAAMIAGQSGSRRVTVDGTEYYLVYAPVGEDGWSLGELVSLDSVHSDARAIGELVQREMQELQGAAAPLMPRLRLWLLCAFVLLLILLAYVSWRWAKRFTAPLMTLSAGVRRVAGGHFTEKLSLDTGDEIQTLAESFNTMTEDLQAHMVNLAAVQAEKAGAEAGLDVAASIQRGLLPGKLPTSDRFTLAACMEPAREVGGDFYDFYELDEHRLVLTVAGISDTAGDAGKGIPAALFMAVARLVLRNGLLSGGGNNLSAALRQAQARMAESGGANHLSINAFVGVLDIHTGELTYRNAACPALLGQAEGIVPLPDAGEKEQQIKLKQGDLLFLSTENRHFPPEMLQAELLKIHRHTPHEVIDAVQSLLQGAEGEQVEDITLLALRWQGK